MNRINKHIEWIFWFSTVVIMVWWVTPDFNTMEVTYYDFIVDGDYLNVGDIMNMNGKDMYVHKETCNKQSCVYLVSDYPDLFIKGQNKNEN